MATTKFYLDTRGIRPGRAASLKIALTQKGRTALISLNVRLRPAQWDGRAEKIIAHPNKFILNNYIRSRKQAVDNLLLKLAETGTLHRIDATEIRRRVLEGERPGSGGGRNLFAERFLKFAASKKQSTKDIYLCTYRRMTAYCGARLRSLAFEDVTKEWLTGFDTFLARTAPSKNARNIHLRNIRAVFNEAIDDEITVFYPFRRFKIRPVATVKRSLNAEQLRTLFNARTEEYAVRHLDAFKLMFFLIGINAVDLFRLKRVTDGRIEYHRAKTGRLYSVKVEPEAMELIDRYRGRSALLEYADRYKSHKDFLKRVNFALKRIGEVRRSGLGGRKHVTPLFPDISTYWARHSWATIASSLDIPKETIAAALGHEIGNPTTSIYIDFDRRKVDEANRRVIDFVLYGRRPGSRVESHITEAERPAGQRLF